MIWLGRGVYNDETDGHIDNLACFARGGVVLLTYAQDESDPQHAISRDALERLQAATDARGRSLEVILLPSPGPIAISEREAGGVDAVAGTLPRRAGDRLAASYVNFFPATTRIDAASSERQCSNWASETAIVTGSEALIASATCAKARCAGVAPSRQLSGRSGHAIQQPACASNSPGMR